MPRLDGIEARAALWTGAETRARLATALLDARIAPASLWHGDVQAFIADALGAWVRRHRGEHVAKRFELGAFLDTSVDRWRSFRSAEHEGVFLGVGPATAAYLEVGAPLARLARVHPQLPATVYSALTEIGRVLYVFDYENAEERLLEEEDWNDEEDPDWQERRAALQPRVPDALRRKPLDAREVARLRRHWPAETRRVVDAARAFAATATAYGTIGQDMPEGRYNIFGDHGIPLPSLVVAFRNHDAISARFDEEMNVAAQGGEEPEPNVTWEIRSPTVPEVRRVFDRFAQWLGVLAAAVDFFDVLVGPRRFTHPRGERLVSVLCDDIGHGPHDLVATRIQLAGAV